MANFINQALSGLQRATPSAIATNQTMNLAGQLFDRGVSGLTDTINRVGEAKKQAAINQIITNTDVSDPFAAHSALFGQISKIPGVSATEALGLSTAAVNNSMQKQQWQNKLDQQMFERNSAAVNTGTGQRLGWNPETQTYDKPIGSATATASKGYGAITDDFGTTYIYNKDTGSYEPIVNASAGAAGGRVSPKNITMKSVTTKDANGNEVTKSYPINKATGTVVENGMDTGKPLPDTVKAPTMSQADRDAALAAKNAFSGIEDIRSKFDPSAVGSFDNAVAVLDNAGGFNVSEDTVKNRELNQSIQNLKANLTAALIKGVPSDRDLQMIEDMLPSTSDSEVVFTAKLNNIEKILKKQYANMAEQQAKRGVTIDPPQPTLNGRPVIFTD
jgi:hypothetical protein